MNQRPVVVGSVLFGADEFVAQMVASRIPHFSGGFGSYAALGVMRSGCLIGGVVYHNYRPHDGDVMVSIAFDRPNWAFPSTLRTLFRYPFVQLDCARMSAVIERENKRSRSITEGLGFKFEGMARKAIARKYDAALYGLLREDCRFLKGKADGQELTIAAAGS